MFGAPPVVHPAPLERAGAGCQEKAEALATASNPRARWGKTLQRVPR